MFTFLLSRLSGTVAFVSLLLVFSVPEARGQYDPTSTAVAESSPPVDLTIRDDGRDRDIPIRAYLPAAHAPAPIIIFSHGLGGSRRGGSYLGAHWSARGYVVVVVQHVGSDESVWQEVPIAKRYSALKSAASLQNSVSRLRDIPVVIDQLAKWNQKPGHLLHGRVDLSRIGMSGHSFGAVTTQGVSGQTPPLIGDRFVEPRIRAAIMLSPSTHGRSDPKRTLGSVTIPWLLITGTKDSSPIGDTTIEDRRKVYSSLPKTIDKYELVLHEAEHFAFADEREQWRKQKRNPNHHRCIQAITTAFWDSYLRDDAEAKKWLQGRDARSVLQPQDQWQANVAKP